MTKVLEQEYYTKEYLKELDLRTDIKFIPLCYDPMFKKVFGNNKGILKRFLMKVLHLDIEEEQCKMVIGVNELPKEQDKNYGSRVDINVIINDTIRINLEVNQEIFDSIVDRNFLFASKMHTLNVESGTKYKDFYKYETIQLNLNTHHFGTEINGEDIFYIKSENTGNRLVNNFKIVIKDLAYFHNLYYTNNGKCESDQIWLAMLMSENFTELDAFLEVLLKKEEREHFLKEVINMCENEFFLHEWEPEAMRQIVEGRKAYNREQERLEDEQRKKEMRELEEKAKVWTKQLEQLEERKEELLQKEEQIKEELLQKEEQIKDETKEETIRNTIISMIKNKINYETISKVTNKTKEEIQEIEKSIQE